MSIATALTPPEWKRWYCHHRDCPAPAYWHARQLVTHLIELHNELDAR